MENYELLKQIIKLRNKAKALEDEMAVLIESAYSAGYENGYVCGKQTIKSTISPSTEKGSKGLCEYSYSLGYENGYTCGKHSVKKGINV